jgi:DNA-binding response OmpR family regulator
MRKTVLVVEDDPRIAQLLRDYFAEEYHVVTAGNGAQALLEFEAHPVDLILLDIMLPILDGWEVCRAIRQRSAVPIVMLTAKTDEASHLRGFELGVDDYVTKPFSPKVLLAKIRAIFKRVENTVEYKDDPHVIDPDFYIHESAHTVTVHGEAINLSATEFSVLLALATHPGCVITRDSILDQVWGENYFGDERVVDTNIKRIREKIGDKAESIKTIRGVGYKLEAN